jgi:hypothetical protein
LEYVFICKECGNIQEYNEKKGTRELKCKVCNVSMDWENSFPPLNALDLINTSRDLLELSKKCDKENLENQYQVILKDEKYTIDKTTLDKYKNQYEKMLEKYPDNDDTLWLEISDNYEDELCKIMDSEQAIAIYSSLRIFNKNYYRKPYIIIVASLIEQLFNDYFKTIIINSLSEYGSKTFLEKYDTAGIQTAIDIVESFLNGSLRDKMDRYSKGFFDKWASLRILRNNVIHSNNKYITKIKISEINKLIDESLIVFSNLKSEIYKPF